MSMKWTLKIEDIRKLLVFDHRYLENIGRVSREYRVNNSGVTCTVLGEYRKSIDEILSLHLLSWLGNVLRMFTYRLP